MDSLTVSNRDTKERPIWSAIANFSRNCQRWRAKFRGCMQKEVDVSTLVGYKIGIECLDKQVTSYNSTDSREGQ